MMTNASMVRAAYAAYMVGIAESHDAAVAEFDRWLEKVEARAYGAGIDSVLSKITEGL